MTTYSVAILGCGAMAGFSDIGVRQFDNYLEALAHSDDLCVSACIDTNRLRAAALARMCGGKAYEELQTALNLEEPDILIISTPDYLHASQVMEAVRHEKPPRFVIVEKPPAWSLKEFDDLMTATDASATEVYVNLPRRLDFRYSQLRQFLREGDLGEVVYGQVTYSGGWKHNAIHALDIMCFLFDEGPKMASLLDYAPGRYEDDPSWSMEGQFPSGSGPIIFRGIDERIFQIFEIDLLLHRGRIRIEDNEFKIRLFTTYEDAAGAAYLKEIDFPNPFPNQSLTARLLSLVLDRLDGGDPPELSLLKLDQIRESMRALLDGDNFAKSTAQQTE